MRVEVDLLLQSRRPPAVSPSPFSGVRTRKRAKTHETALPLAAHLPHSPNRFRMNDKLAIRGLYGGWALGLVLLGLAVSGKHPYGFYTLLRWIVCAVFAYSATVAYRAERPVWTWLFAVEAMLFNPFVRVHFNRNTWQIVDWCSLASILVAAAVFSNQLRSPPTPP